jgi:hypothetical protein
MPPTAIPPAEATYIEPRDWLIEALAGARPLAAAQVVDEWQGSTVAITHCSHCSPGERMPALDTPTEEHRMGAIARYAAAKVGLIAARPRGRRRPDAPRGFSVFDKTGSCIAGHGYTMSAQEVIDFCERLP